MIKIQTIVRNILTDQPEQYILDKIKELIEKNPTTIDLFTKTISNKPGVYIIYNKNHPEQNFIYVGETDNLYRRLIGDISRGKKRYHTFLRKIAQEKNILEETQLKKYINENYVIAFIETVSKEAAFIIEGVLIKAYSPKYNKNKKTD